MIVASPDEPNDILEMLKLLYPNLKIDTLDVGDYLVRSENTNIPIERKTVNDYISSICDGRYHNQLYRLSTLYPLSYLIVVGDIEAALMDRKFDREALVASLISATLKRSPDGARGIVIPLIVPDEGIFCLFLYYLDKILNEGKLVRAPIPKVHKSDMRELLVGTVSTFPGVGRERARTLMEKFGTLQSLVNADVSRLEDVTGIGRNTALKIYKYCRLYYRDMN